MKIFWGSFLYQRGCVFFIVNIKSRHCEIGQNRFSLAVDPRCITHACRPLVPARDNHTDQQESHGRVARPSVNKNPIFVNIKCVEYGQTLYEPQNVPTNTCDGVRRLCGCCGSSSSVWLAVNWNSGSVNFYSMVGCRPLENYSKCTWYTSNRSEL